MTSFILVTVRIRTLGRRVVSRPRGGGGDVRVLSPRQRNAELGRQFVTGDPATHEGIEAAVHSMSLIVHCASSQVRDAEATRDRLSFD